MLLPLNRRDDRDSGSGIFLRAGNAVMLELLKDVVLGRRDADDLTEAPEFDDPILDCCDRCQLLRREGC